MSVIKNSSLFYTEGSSDKEYHAQLVKTDKGFVVNFQYGRRGSALKPGTKTLSALPKDQAEKVFDKLVASKEAKGYTPMESGEVFSSEEFKQKKTNILPQLLNPISEEEMEVLLEDDDYFAQEKYDGERRLAESDSEVVGINRKGLAVQLPDTISRSIKSKVTVDAEIIGDHLYVFDVLSLEGKDVRSQSALERILLLEGLKFGKSVSAVFTARSTAEKRKLLKDLRAKNAEGIVFKKASAAYKVGKPANGGSALKFKFYKTASFIVTNISKAKRSVEVSLLEKGEEVSLGNVTIPPNKEIPKVGEVVEVRYLYAYKGGSVFQPVYLGARTDIDQDEATIDQLVYKKED